MGIVLSAALFLVRQNCCTVCSTKNGPKLPEPYMNLARCTILTALFLGLVFQPIGAAALGAAKQPAEPTGYFHRLKSAGRIASAMGLGLTAYIATELPIILLHECGHYFGNRLTGGRGGQIELQCNLLRHPLAVFMPFFGQWGNADEAGNRLACLVTGPFAGLTANYAIMIAANALYASRNGGSDKESLKIGLKSPLQAYKNISDIVEKMIAEQGAYKTPPFAEIFMMTFNTLRATRLIGEFVYGLTPISIAHGDGQQIWRELGFEKDMTVTPWGGFLIALSPLMAATAFGIAKGVYKRLKTKRSARNC